MKQTVLAIAAHNDDHVLGAGGTLAKYVKKGMRMHTVIFSLGELHVYMKKNVIIETRKKEFKEGDELMGGSGASYLGCRDGHVSEDIEKKDMAKKLTHIINKEKPAVIFTHGFDDAHPDHRAVHRLIMKLIDEKVIKCPVYSFDIWSLVRLRKRNQPKMVVDVSDTFTTKIKAFLVHKSQKIVWWLMVKAVVKDWFSGLLHGYRYAEVFYRLK